MAKRSTIRQRVKKIIGDELGFTNGWAVTEERFDVLCDLAALKILRYLRGQSKLARQHVCKKVRHEA